MKIARPRTQDVYILRRPFISVLPQAIHLLRLGFLNMFTMAPLSKIASLLALASTGFAQGGITPFSVTGSLDG
jgi:hypothetical protein